MEQTDFTHARADSDWTSVKVSHVSPVRKAATEQHLSSQHARFPCDEVVNPVLGQTGSAQLV